MQTIRLFRSSPSMKMSRLRTHDFRASLTIVCLAFCSLTLVFLSSLATHLGFN